MARKRTEGGARPRQIFVRACARVLARPDGALHRRTAAILADLDLVTITPDPVQTASFVDRLRSGIPEQIARGFFGPLVLVPPESGHQATVISLELAILDEHANAREQLRAYLEALAVQQPLSKSTRQLVNRFIATPESAGDSWRRPALLVGRALHRDWLFNLAGVRQAAEINLQATWNEHLRAVLKPDCQSIAECIPGLLSPTHHVKQFQARSNELGKSDLAVPVLAEEYMLSVGHLPCSGANSLGAILSARLNGDLSETSLAQLWKWADDHGSPLAQYHAVQATLSVAGSVPTEFLDRAAHAIEEALPFVQDDSAWSLVEMYARYFHRYLELQLPTDDGDFVASMAWWMALRLSTETGGPSDDLGTCIEHFQSIYETRVGMLWELTGPSVRPSTLRHLTLFGPSPWVLSMLSELGRSRHCSEVLRASDGALLGDTLSRIIGVAMLSKPLPPSPAAPTYGYDSLALSELMVAAAELVTDANQKEALRMWSEPILWSDTDPVSEILDGLKSAPEQNRAWLRSVLRVRAQLGLLPEDQLWTALTNEVWQRETLPTLRPEDLQAIGSGMLEVAKAQRPPWSADLSHLFAYFAENFVHEDLCRKSCIMIALQAGAVLRTTSVFKRLARGPSRIPYIECAETLRLHLEQLIPCAGRWAGGRAREVLSVIDASIGSG